MNQNINSKRRTRGQQRIALSMDADLLEWVGKNETNRNRYINGLVRQDMERRWMERWAKIRGENLGELMTHIHEQIQEELHDE